MSKSKVASIRALQELRGIVISRLEQTFSKKLHEEEKLLGDKRKELSKRIQEEIEAYAVEKYAQFGIKIIPICHRSGSYQDSDVVRAELKIKTFPFTDEAYELLKKKKEAAYEQVEDWYFKAVQAVASQVDLPPTPEFEA